MNYISIVDTEVVNGFGVGTTIFVSGCTHKCKKCFNPQTWNETVGSKIDDKVIDTLVDTLKNKRRLTVSGGDPFEPYNMFDTFDLVNQIKQRTNVKIWVYTGYNFEDIYNYLLKVDKLDYLNNIDYIVDGEYKYELKPLAFRGSSNQKIWFNNNSEWEILNEIV